MQRLRIYTNRLYTNPSFAEKNAMCFCFVFPVGLKGNRFHYWKNVLIFSRGPKQMEASTPPKRRPVAPLSPFSGLSRLLRGCEDRALGDVLQQQGCGEVGAWLVQSLGLAFGLPPVFSRGSAPNPQ